MFVHIGLKHRLLQQFLPEILHEVLFKQQPQVRQKMDTSQEDQNYFPIFLSHRKNVMPTFHFEISAFCS